MSPGRANPRRAFQCPALLIRRALMIKEKTRRPPNSLAADAAGVGAVQLSVFGIDFCRHFLGAVSGHSARGAGIPMGKRPGFCKRRIEAGPCPI